MDWPHFWNQFKAEIDRSELAAITKFSYLKEFVLVPQEDSRVLRKVVVQHAVFGDARKVERN